MSKQVTRAEHIKAVSGFYLFRDASHSIITIVSVVVVENDKASFLERHDRPSIPGEGEIHRRADELVARYFLHAEAFRGAKPFARERQPFAARRVPIRHQQPIGGRPRHRLDRVRSGTGARREREHHRGSQ